MADHYHPESTFPVYDKIDMADSEKEGLNPKKGSKRSLNRPGHCKRLLLALLVVSLVAILMGILLGVAKYVTHKRGIFEKPDPEHPYPLGGFAALTPINSTEELRLSFLYTSQNGTARQTLGDQSVVPATQNIKLVGLGPSNVIKNMLPGSPLAASVAPNHFGSSHARAFYVDENNTIQEAYTDYSKGFAGIDSWFPGSFGSLNLTIGDNMVLTTVPAPYNESSRYTQDDQLVMYMFYSPPDGSIKKYAIWANSTTGQSRPVLESDGSMPPRSFNALSCQIQNGTETIFGVNGNQTIEQWYRLFDTENSTWIQTKHNSSTLATGVLYRSSIATLFDPVSKSTNVFFQRSFDSIVWSLLYAGLGANSTLSSEAIGIEKVTPRSRLTSWLSRGNWYSGINVYYQSEGTADINWTSFGNPCSSFSGGVCMGGWTQGDTQRVPNVETWGLKRIGLTVSDITGIAVGSTVGLFMILASGYAVHRCFNRRSSK